MKYYLAAALAMVACAPAHAEVFNGGHIGIQAGAESNRIDSEAAFAGQGLGSVAVDKKSQTAATIGITLGYDSVIGDSFVLGGEIAGTFSTGGNRQTLLFSSAPTSPVNINYKSEFTLEATLRAGFLVGHNTLLYARAGYANSKLKSDASSGGVSLGNISGNNNGIVFGGGVEHALSEKISARLEYKHFEMKGPVTREQVIVGVGYSF